jgi:hypothetical protein
MPKAGKRIAVVLPGPGAVALLERSLSAIPADWVDRLVVVDEGPPDTTAALVARIPPLVTLPAGGGVKACIVDALRAGADVVVVLRPAGAFEALLVPKLAEPVVEDRADVVLGARADATRTASARALAAVANALTGSAVSDLRTGHRAYARRVLTDLAWLQAPGEGAEDELLFRAERAGLRVEEVPVRETPAGAGRRRGVLRAALRARMRA